ncbi:hypothetical protein FSARC_7736 [Fusarium sarcochroum]|uniref:AAA+ ATPase domain-containing protein n=1 Tax=Fusarium sarcochroum TaxID=1208366 RepID=A0A8H4TUN0_9HYPO|nr:hypothetical protein FSARC_7736 [Fusarium sarcochroum]
MRNSNFTVEELDPSLYTIAWIAPLEVEAQAALHMLDHRHDGRFPMTRGDDYVFRAGDINGHNIVVATLPAGQEYGTGSAAALASQINKFFPNLWFGLLVGVAAGLPNLTRTPPIDIRLGDVIVGLPEGESADLIAYDLGKETAGGFQLLRFGLVLANTETVVRSAIGNIKMMTPNDADVFLPFYEDIKDKEHSKGTFADPGQENDVFYDVSEDGVGKAVHRDERDANRRTRVWYGPIGSGDKLTKNARKRNELRDRYGVIGLEMEAAGTMNRIPVGVIRGVCDYADEHKNKEWQPYAATMAAAYAKAVLHELGPEKVVLKQGSNITPALHDATLCDLPPNTDRFFGRDKELSEMRANLETSNQRKRVVLCGISGSGKTQLAREYIARRGDRFSAVLWIDAGSEESIEQSMSSCASRICEEIPGFRPRKQSTPPYQLVFEWLRTTFEKSWLVVVDNANDLIPSKRLLGPLREMKHGALCDTSTHQSTARALQFKEILIERLDLSASQSLILWKAYESDQDQAKEVHDAARHIAKLLDGYPLALELAGILHQRGITSLHEFSNSFAEKYPDIAQFEIDSGVWTWTRAGASESLFSMLDTLYESLEAKAPQAADQTLLGFSLHAAVCQWRLATMENRDFWIIQAAWSLARHVESRDAPNDVYRFFSMFDRCLTAIWKHVHRDDLEPLHGKFAAPYYIICSCGAGIYLSMGNSERTKSLFIAALDYARSTQTTIVSDNGLLRLLSGLARSCVKTREFEMAEEALTSATEIAKETLGYKNDQTVHLTNRLEMVKKRIDIERDNRQRAVVASTGNKLPKVENQLITNELRSAIKSALWFGQFSSPLSHIEQPCRLTPLPLEPGSPRPALSWGILLEEPVIFLAESETGQDLASTPNSVPGRVRGKVTILAHEPVKIQSVNIILNGLGRLKWDRGVSVSDAFFDESHTLELCNTETTSRHAPYGKNCTHRLDNSESPYKLIVSSQSFSADQDATAKSTTGTSNHGFKRLERDDDAGRGYVLFQPGCYDYSFEFTVNPQWPESVQTTAGIFIWYVQATMRTPGRAPFEISKNLPVVRIPPQSEAKTASPKGSFGQYSDEISLQVGLKDNVCAIGSRIPIIVTLNLLGSGLEIEYMSYSIAQTEEYWTHNRRHTLNTPVYVVEFLKKLARRTHPASSGGSIRSHRENEATSSLPEDSETSIRYNPEYLCLGFGIIYEVLAIYLCAYDIDSMPLEIAIGGYRLDPGGDGLRIQWEVLKKIPVEVADCRIVQRPGLAATNEANLNGYKDEFCGCSKAKDFFKASYRTTTPRNLTSSIGLRVETSASIMEAYGQDKEEVRQMIIKLNNQRGQPNLSFDDERQVTDLTLSTISAKQQAWIRDLYETEGLVEVEDDASESADTSEMSMAHTSLLRWKPTRQPLPSLLLIVTGKCEGLSPKQQTLPEETGVYTISI